MKQIIHTDEAPATIGAYSQATTNGDLVSTAGQIPLTPDSELRADAPVAEQTELALVNLEAILTEAGTGPEDVLKTTVFLTDIDDFDEMNEAYGDFFDGFDAEPPARSAVQAGALPKGVAVEAVAAVE